MRPLLTPEQMGRADAATIASGTPGEVLMERAGRAVARSALRVTGGRYGRRAVIVCGKGNNGGDGFVAARVLRSEGLGVRCLFVGDPSAVRGAARWHLEELSRAGVSVEDFDSVRLEGADVIVDALFGTGFRGAAEGDPGKAIDAMSEADAPVVSVDIPSGVNGATGGVEGRAVRARTTVAMAAEKLGTALPPGAVYAGRVEVADIGIHVGDSDVAMCERADVAAVLPRRPPDAHKRSMGAVAVLGGSAGMSGAVVLSATAALRMGAGYVTAGTTRSVDDSLSAALPEALTTVVSDTDVLGVDALDRFADVLDRAQALAIGPGLGRGDEQAALVEGVLARIDLPLVVDADGLNVLAGRTEHLRARTAPAVITPHPAELARLLGVATSDVQGDRLTSATEAAHRFQCTVVLKGFRTLIADSSGRVVVNPTGGAELATAGTGDVLTGVVAALLAAGLRPFDAAWSGVYVHGAAGSIAAEALDPSGVVAGDVARHLPEARARISGG
jgi:ADP-dependent NAD(P)H-hydrate dehydratase / NAD(P)H-hydrate epimerase